MWKTSHVLARHSRRPASNCQELYHVGERALYMIRPNVLLPYSQGGVGCWAPSLMADAVGPGGLTFEGEQDVEGAASAWITDDPDAAAVSFDQSLGD